MIKCSLCKKDGGYAGRYAGGSVPGNFNLWNWFPHVSCPSDVGNSLCKPPAQYYQGSCYTLSDAKGNFQQAKESCQKIQGYLAQITSVGENRFIEQMNGAQQVERWIGYNDLESHGTWVWEGSSTKTAYSNWQNSYPQTGEGDCTAFQPNGTWVNQHCAKVQKYVCEKGTFHFSFLSKKGEEENERGRVKERQSWAAKPKSVKYFVGLTLNNLHVVRKQHSHYNTKNRPIHSWTSYTAVLNMIWILAEACCFFVSKACNHVFLKLWSPMPAWISLTALIQGKECCASPQETIGLSHMKGLLAAAFFLSLTNMLSKYCLAIMGGHSMRASRLDFNSFTCLHTLWIWY